MIYLQSAYNTFDSKDFDHSFLRDPGQAVNKREVFNKFSGWSVTAGGRGISLPTQAYPPATFPKA